MNKMIIMASLALSITACGNARQSTDESAIAGDTVETVADLKSDVAQAASQSQPKTYQLTNKGVGPIVLGMKVSEIPAAVPGLYDRVEKVETPDAWEYHFYMGDMAIFAAEDEGDGIVSGISLMNETPIKDASSAKEGYITL